MVLWYADTLVKDRKRSKTGIHMKIKILPGCISCGTCEAVCPKVFQINSISQVRENVNLQEYKNCIKEAAEMCPVDAIEITWDDEQGED